MSIFRPYQSDDLSDRTASDRSRHREKMKEQIKENLPDFIANESIISKEGNKTIKIPLRRIKEPRFSYGPGTKQAGQGQGDGSTQRGTVISRRKKQGQGSGKEAGSEAGEDYYEVEVPADEFDELIFEDLELPDLERKKFRLIVDKVMVSKGIRRKGIWSRLSRDKTMREHLRRKGASGFTAIAETLEPELTEFELKTLLDASVNDLEQYQRIRNAYYPDPDRPGIYILRFPIIEDDYRFRHREITEKESSNAVVICMMDTSGSMGAEKKYLARLFFFLLCRFVKNKYEHVEIVFITHETEAKVMATEEEFFTKGESGGTMISSAYNLALKVIAEQFPQDEWNIYPFHCSDGDNYNADNEVACVAARQLALISNLFGYCEVNPDMVSRIYSMNASTILSENIKSSHFVTILLRTKADIWPSFQKLMKHERVKA